MSKILLSTILIFIVGNSIATEYESYQPTDKAQHGIGRILPILGGVAVASFFVDEPTNKLMLNNQSSFFNSVSDITDFGGDKYIIFPAAILTYATARFITEDEKMQSVAWQSLQSIVVSALATETIKQLAGRARPYNEKGAFHFKPFPMGNDDFKSMPSGHSVVTFAAFTPFAESYSRWLYLIPAFVAAGRVYQNQHWFSDVVVGSSIGFISGYLFTHNKQVQLIPNGIVVNF